jgi:hypothetical protein
VLGEEWRTDRFGTGGSMVYNSSMPGACARKKSCPCDIISGSGALCGTGDAEDGEELAVCQACPLRLNSSRILIANRRDVSAAGDDSGKKKAKTLAVALSVGDVGAAALAAAAVALYLVAYRKRDTTRRR